LFPDGSFNYTPRHNFTGPDSFGFFANDGYLSSVDPRNNSVVQPSFVTIYVEPAGLPENDPRVLVSRDSSYPFDAVLANGASAPSPITVPKLGERFITGVRPLPSHENIYNNNILPSFQYTRIQIDPVYRNRILTAIDLLGGPESAPGTGIVGFGTGYPTFDLSRIDPNSFKDGNLDLTFTYSTVGDIGVLGQFLSNFVTVHLVINGLSDKATLDTSSGPVVVQAPPGTALNGASIVSPVPPGAPQDLTVPWLISFTLDFPYDSPYSNGTAAEVTILLPAGAPHFTTYYKEEAGPGGIHWYPFMYDPASGHPTGAEILNDPSSGQQTIILHLVYGALGDEHHSGTFAISDPGGPAFFTNPAQNFVASVYEDVLGRAPSDAEMAGWVKKLDRHESRLQVAQTIWKSTEHRRLQVQQWSTQFLGHPAGPAEQAHWVNLLRRGRGEIAVEQSILTSPDYLRAHPTMASFAAGLAHDVLHQAGNAIDPAQGRLRHRGQISRGNLAHQVLTSPAAAALLAQQDATTFLGRPATTQETLADQSILRRASTAPEQIAERILSSSAFFNFVNSALLPGPHPAGPGRNTHLTARHLRGH
jgi:hypothetical protein